MSDLMTRGVIMMPLGLAMSSELSRMQFHSRAQEVLRERDELLAALKEAEKTLAHCKADVGYSKKQTETAIMLNRLIAKYEAQP